MHSFNYDVVIVGAGPSGLTTAIAATRAGAPVLVIEKHPGVSIFPKALGVRARTMEILRGWGLDAAVVAASQRVDLSMSVQPVLTGPRTTTSLGFPTPEELRAVSPSPLAACSQDRLEVILLEHLRERGGEVRFETELTGSPWTATWSR